MIVYATDPGNVASDGTGRNGLFTAGLLAAFKGALIALDYMELRHAPRLWRLLVLGWLALVAVVPLWRALSPAGFAWLAAGGAVYTLGVVFYAADHRIPHGHGLWHLFVLAGSACHFTTVLVYVA